LFKIFACLVKLFLATSTYFQSRIVFIKNAIRGMWYVVCGITTSFDNINPFAFFVKRVFSQIQYPIRLFEPNPSPLRFKLLYIDQEFTNKLTTPSAIKL